MSMGAPVLLSLGDVKWNQTKKVRRNRTEDDVFCNNTL